jgi:hypothetical protein
MGGNFSVGGRGRGSGLRELRGSGELSRRRIVHRLARVLVITRAVGIFGLHLPFDLFPRNSPPLGPCYTRVAVERFGRLRRTWNCLIGKLGET